MKKMMLVFAAALTLFTAQTSHANDAGEIVDAYSSVTGAAIKGTFLLPLSPTATTYEFYNPKVILAAKEDAAFFVATGEIRPQLQQALNVLRQQYNIAGSDEEIVMALLAE